MISNRYPSTVLCAMFVAALASPCLAGCDFRQAPVPEAAEAATTESAAAQGERFDAQEYMQRLEHCVEQVREKTDFEPEVAIVLGSGLGSFADNVDVAAEVSYADIEGFPLATAPSHAGRLVFGTLGGKRVAVMQGRVHYYEGYSMPEVVLPLRLLHELGARTVILTNAVGSLNPDFGVGEFMAVEDHISSFVPSPLIGQNLDDLGERFTDMTGAYDPELVDLACELGEELGIAVRRGTFLQTTGPQFETPAEIEMFRALGADTVGMSTAVETIAARHMGMRVCAINSITNMAAGMGEALDGDEVVQNANDSGAAFTELLLALVEGLS